MTADRAAWPEGFFKIERSFADHCASVGCHQIPSMRLDVGGVGSNYCEPCARKIAAIIKGNNNDR